LIHVRARVPVEQGGGKPRVSWRAERVRLSGSVRVFQFHTFYLFSVSSLQWNLARSLYAPTIPSRFSSTSRAFSVDEAHFSVLCVFFITHLVDSHTLFFSRSYARCSLSLRNFSMQVVPHPFKARLSSIIFTYTLFPLFIDTVLFGLSLKA
jgi:hypothetical protein